MFGIEFDYLRPNQKDVNQIIHSNSYIKQGHGINGNRKIFAGVEYEQIEKEKIAQLKQYLLQNMNNNQFLTDSNLLRSLQAYKYDIQEAYNQLNKIIKWQQNPKNYEINEETKRILDSGIIYIGGRDHELRPIIYFNLEKYYSIKFDPEDFKKATSRLFLIMRDYMFVEGKVENWIVVVNTNDLSFHEIPLGALNSLIKQMGELFPGRLERCFLLNPSRTLQTFWSLIKVVIDEKSSQKVLFVQKQQVLIQLKSIIKDNTQIEKYLGGLADNISQYYPPNPLFLNQQNNLIQSIDQNLNLNYFNAYSQRQTEKFNQQTKNYDNNNFSIQNKNNNIDFQQQIFNRSTIQNPQHYQAVKKNQDNLYLSNGASYNNINQYNYETFNSNNISKSSNSKIVSEPRNKKNSNNQQIRRKIQQEQQQNLSNISIKNKQVYQNNLTLEDSYQSYIFEQKSNKQLQDSGLKKEPQIQNNSMVLNALDQNSNIYSKKHDNQSNKRPAEKQTQLISSKISSAQQKQYQYYELEKSEIKKQSLLKERKQLEDENIAVCQIF